MVVAVSQSIVENPNHAHVDSSILEYDLSDRRCLGVAVLVAENVAAWRLGKWLARAVGEI